jgi:cysteine desulfurase/selenocysteine lyase
MTRNNRITIENVREHILGIDYSVPLLNGSSVQYVNFDNAASTPTLTPIVRTLEEFMKSYSSIHRGTGFKSQLTTYYFEQSREIIARFFNVYLDNHLVIFGKNGTEAINKLARRVPLPEESIILISKMEHHSNDLPWRFRQPVMHINVDNQGRLDWDDFSSKLDQNRGKVAIVAMTGASNVTGYINDVYEVAEIAHNYGARVMIDAAQLAPHRKIDIKPPGHPQHLDFVAISAHKMYAPYGLGVLIADKDMFQDGEPDVVGGGTVMLVSEDSAYWTDAPEKEEAGTPNVAGAIALAKALNIIDEIGMEHIAQHETVLTAYALEQLRSIPGITIYGSVDENDAANRLGVISFNLKDKHHGLVSAILNYEGGIGVRDGCFCAHPYVKSLLGVSVEEARVLEEQILSKNRSRIPGAVRMSFGMYNTKEEIDRMIELLGLIARDQYKGKYYLNKETGEYFASDFSIKFEEYFKL